MFLLPDSRWKVPASREAGTMLRSAAFPGPISISLPGGPCHQTALRGRVSLQGLSKSPERTHEA